jgi:hypothetical protein
MHVCNENPPEGTNLPFHQASWRFHADSPLLSIGRSMRIFHQDYI